MSRILIWHQGALGDLILSLPAIYAVRRYAPATWVCLVSRTDLSGIIISNNLADEVVSHDKGLFAALFTHFENMPGPLREFLMGFKAAFIFTNAIDSIFTENIRDFVPECYSVMTIPPAGIRRHVSAFQLDQVQAIIGAGQEMTVFGPLSCDRAVSGSGPVVAVHPGSGGKKKRWPLDNYLRLIELLDRQKGLCIRIILGPAEADEDYRRTSAFISEKKIDADIIRGKSVAEIASLLKSSSLYIGNDSGISHLAALQGTPVIVIFGPTDHELWKPAGRNVVVLRSEVVCSPCAHKVYSNCTAPVCFESISPEDVFEAIISAGVFPYQEYAGIANKLI